MKSRGRLQKHIRWHRLEDKNRMDQKKGVVRGICISKKRGTAKYPVESARIVPDWGIEEDAHGGKWHRQISLLALEKIEAFREQGADVDFGAFGENLIIEGFDLRNVPVDSEIRIGDTVRLKVTQIGMSQPLCNLSADGRLYHAERRNFCRSAGRWKHLCG